MSLQDVLNCSFPLWYSNFKQNTIKSAVIQLPQVFIDYLLADGVFLPDDQDDVDIVANEEYDDSTQVTNDDKTKSQRMFLKKEFVELKSNVTSAIAELGGKVFSKLNWSSPKDASWIAVNGSLCCENFNDICLLLKSSEFITHDLTNPFSMSDQLNSQTSSGLTENYVLVLRQWLDISSSGEYRCFVRNSKLVAISQRSTQHFSFIDTDKDAIIHNVYRFFKNCIRGKFPNSSYVIDLYLPGNDRKPVIIDFNPFLVVTESLLFSWDELEGNEAMTEIADGLATRGIVFRSVPAEGVMSTEMRNHAFPLDFQDLATGEDPAKLIDLLKLHQRSGSKPSIDSIDSD